MKQRKRRLVAKWLYPLTLGALTTGVLTLSVIAQPQNGAKHYDSQGHLLKPYGSTPGEKAFIRKAEGFAIANRKMQRLESKEWIGEKWTGNNQPYRAITREVQELLRQNRLALLLPRYQSAAQENPLDARLQYRYVLADFSLEMQDWPLERDKPRRWREDLACPDSPQTLDYARLRFLVEAAHYDDQKLRPLGARLLQAAPGDNWVSFFVNHLRKVSYDPKDIRQNLTEAYAKLKLNPNDRKAGATIAEERMKIWVKSQKRSDAQATIAAYRRYQESLPVASPRISLVEQRIRDINISQEGFDRRNPKDKQ